MFLFKTGQIQGGSFPVSRFLKSGHSKVMHIQYNNLKMQYYFLSNQISTLFAKFTFSCRSRMVTVGANYKAGNQRPLCPLCKVEYDSQPHLLVCAKLTNKDDICQKIPLYDDLFCENWENKIKSYKRISKIDKT